MSKPAMEENPVAMIAAHFKLARAEVTSIIPTKLTEAHNGNGLGL